MTLGEFKAWFEGYTENIEKVPTAKQWARVKDRVAQIDGVPVTREVWVERYRPYWPYQTDPWSVYIQNISASPTYCSNNAALVSDTAKIDTFNSSEAMFALGQAEASGSA